MNRLADSSHQATTRYVAPFLAFIAMMALESAFSLPAIIYYPLRFLTVIALLLLLSRPVIRLRPSYFWGSAGIGILVFVIWVAPDLLFGYRNHWLFSNALTGSAKSSVPESLRTNLLFVAVRLISCTVAVPLLEELFWRGWLMRWLIAKDFTSVSYRYVPSAFWTVAVMFASEHGPYWEVGLLAGIIYNWWIIRTGNLADTILAHAVTNGLLSGYVLLTGRWEYWL